MKRDKRTAAEIEEVPAAREDSVRWNFFFSCQRYPVYRSQLITALMAGTVLDVERLPSPVLLDVVLLATASRIYHEAEIVSNYADLLERVRTEWDKPDWTCKVFSQIHARWAHVVLNGRRDFDNVEEAYIPDLVGWYLNHEVPKFFSEEEE